MLLKNKKLFHTVKTQVTAFILVGLLIIAIVWSALYISEYFSEKEIEKFAPVGNQLTLESNTIKENIDSCVQSLTDKGMQLMSDQGLYLEIPENYTYNNRAYWLKNTINIMPHNFEKIDQDLAYYINTNIPNCANLDEFKENGWDISPFIPSTIAKIQEQDIGIDVKYTINVKKQDFERQFSNSIYNPKIRFRQMYGKAVEFMNTQLLRPDFDFNNPLKDYDITNYPIAYERLNNQTLLFSIIDSQSKILDGKPFTLTFVADFSINNIPRTYDVSNSHETRVLYSPDRLAVLIIPPDAVSSSDKVTIAPYEIDSVIRKNTPIEKIGKTVTQTKDITFNTKYPIYRFSPSGTTFSEPAFLRIYLNKDQREIEDQLTLLYYGKNGWLPYPNIVNSSEGFIDTLIHGFSKLTATNCTTLSTQNYAGPKSEAERSFWETWGATILTVLAILILLYSLGAFGSPLPEGGKIVEGAINIGDTPAKFVSPHGIAEGTELTVKLTEGVPTFAELVPATPNVPAHFVLPPGATITSIPTGVELTLASGTVTAPSVGALSGLANILSKIPVLGTTLGFIAPSKIAALGSLSVSSYLAYNLWNGASDTEDTFTIKPACNSTIHISPKGDDGDCKCFIQEMPGGDIKSVSGTYDVIGNNAYTVTSTVTDFDYGYDEASCQCEITGVVTTVSSDQPSTECNVDLDCGDYYEFCNNDKCEEKEIEEKLVSCLVERVCLENVLESNCEGESIESTCDYASSDPVSRRRPLDIKPSENTDSGFGREGDSFQLSSYLPDATEDKIVIAHLKRDPINQNDGGEEITGEAIANLGGDGTIIESIILQKDENEDGHYVGNWDSENVLGNQDSLQIIGDIEITDNSGNTETILNAASTTVIDRNSDCEPVGILLTDSSLDIIFIDELSQNAEETYGKIISTNPFTQYYSTNGINFYKTPNTNNNCGNAQTKLTIKFNNQGCTQQNNIVELDPSLFTFKSEISNTDIDNILNNFCGYIRDLSVLNPPVATMETRDIVTVPGLVDIKFNINDEEYPVDYELLWNHIPLKQSQVPDGSTYKHTLNLTSGDWIVQIKARDQQGMVGYSDMVSISIEDNNGGEIE